MKKIHRKYEFTGETKIVNGTLVRQIMAAQKVETDEIELEIGELGGWIEHESNLSHDGLCWIEETCVVMGNSCVKDDIFIMNQSLISGHTLLSGTGCVQDSIVKDTILAGNLAHLECVDIKDCILDGMVELVFGRLEKCRISQKQEEVLSLLHCDINSVGYYFIIENLPEDQLLLENVTIGFSMIQPAFTKRKISATGTIKNFVAKEMKQFSFTNKVNLNHIEINDCSILTHNVKRESQQLECMGNEGAPIRLEDGIFCLLDSEMIGDGISLKGNISLSDVGVYDSSQILNHVSAPIVLKDVRLADMAKIEKNTSAETIIEEKEFCDDEWIQL